MASSPASAAHGASARAGWIGREDGTGGFKFSRRSGEASAFAAPRVVRYTPEHAAEPGSG
jgi:hypothetical protein